MKKYNPDIHHRRSIRLQNYDYSQCGAYFITICTNGKHHIFGNVSNGILALNVYGNIVNEEWLKTERVRKNVVLDEYIIMPNHLHAIIILNDDPVESGKIMHKLSEIIRSFKTFSARRINNMRKMTGLPLWQRNYYERIIRNEDELRRIQEYIINNPLDWEKDEYYET